MRPVCRLITGAALSCALAVPADAQRRNSGHRSTPPDSTILPPPTVAAPIAIGGAPFAWIDDASLLPAGAMSVTLSTLVWQGADLTEVEMPVTNIAVGVTPRVQVGAIVPYVIGSSDPTGVLGGLGTTFVSAKVAILTGAPSGVKLTVAPTREILGPGTVQTLTTGTSPVQFGLPVSLEIGTRAGKVVASGGFFSDGVWFAGGGVGGQITPRLGVSVVFSRAWSTDAISAVVHSRNDLTGTAAVALTTRFALFASLGTTIATADQDGAGTTVSGGVLLFLAPVTKR